MVDGEGLGSLEEPDELETVQAMGAGFVAVDLREPWRRPRVEDDKTVDVGVPEEPADGMHHRDTEESISPVSPSWRM